MKMESFAMNTSTISCGNSATVSTGVEEETAGSPGGSVSTALSQPKKGMKRISSWERDSLTGRLLVEGSEAVAIKHHKELQEQNHQLRLQVEFESNQNITLRSQMNTLSNRVTELTQSEKHFRAAYLEVRNSLQSLSQRNKVRDSWRRGDSSLKDDSCCPRRIFNKRCPRKKLNTSSCRETWSLQMRTCNFCR